jgi:hypothetical protein
VGNDNINAVVTVNTSGNTSNSGHLKASDTAYVGIQTVSSLNGDDHANYALTEVKGDYKVNKRDLSFGGIRGIDRLYNGNTEATVDTSGIQKTGLIQGDEVNVLTTGNFRNANNTANDKNVARDSSGNVIAKTVALTVEGNDVGNYNITGQTTTTAKINAAKLTEVSGSKTYDGNDNLSNGTLTIKGVNGEQFTADKATVTLASKNVADNATNSVTNISALALTSKDNSTTELASNYDLSQGAVNNSVTITPKALSIIGLTVKDKTFDGTTAAEVSNPGFLDGLVAGESLIHTTTANFNDPNVGSSKPVNVNVELISETTRNGNHRNYSLNPPTNIRASITNPVEPVVPPTPVVPVTPPSNPNVVVSVAAANNNFVLAGADGQCSADALEECECESASSPAGEALDGIQICFASGSSAKE